MRVKDSKTRVMKTTEQFWAKKTVTGSENMEAWRVARERIGARHQYTEDRQQRPNSAASLDRRRSRRRSRDQREKPRSASAGHNRHRRTEQNLRAVNQFTNMRNVMLSDDSGHSSLSTYTGDSRKSMNKDVKEGRWE